MVNKSIKLLCFADKILRHTSTNMLRRGFLFSAQSVASCSAGGNKQQPLYTVISGQWPKSMLKSWEDTNAHNNTLDSTVVESYFRICFNFSVI